ncbi:SUMF1/EgtB/PvdO family nonheme iron enzyme [Streptomyces sp. NPDC096152]|uniref:SUMF1/EgtB/PvdO family nonheme iron enzyme n=1 Tax=Streptomyces sp. NPDC096152 TaxID=3366078 RepID=UPI0038057961
MNEFLRARALVVGVETYAAGRDWKLAGPAADALRFTDWLLTMGTPAANISLFANSAAPSALDDWRQRTGMNVEEPTCDAIHAALLDVVREHPCDVLFLFWGGHGITDPEGRLRLFTCDAHEEVLRNVDLDDLMMAFRSTTFAKVRRQILMVDACRRFVSHRELRRGLPTVSLPRGELGQTDQFTLCATREGDLAVNLTGAGTGRLSSVLLRELPTTPGRLPDMEAVARQVRAEFERLRTAGDTTQVPVFYSSRGYDGSVRSEQLVPWATPAAAPPVADARQYVRRLARKLEGRLVGDVRLSGMGPSFDSLERSSVVTRAHVRSTAISAEHTLVPDVADYVHRTQVRRMIVSGAPGMGKSVLLDLLALAQCRAYQVDESAIPVQVTSHGDTAPGFFAVEDMLRRALPFLYGVEQDELLHRCVFYCDAFDEMPPRQQADVLDFMRVHPHASIILSTRTTRGLDWSVPNCVEVELLPLDPPEVLRQLECELGSNAAEDVFWRLAGRDYEVVRDSWQAAGGSRDQLWSLSATVPRRLPGEMATLRLKLLRDPPAALQLARTPFLLRAMVTIRREGEYVDLSKPDVLHNLVQSLWTRLHAEVGYRDITLDQLFSGLAPLAVQLIRERRECYDLASATALLVDAGQVAGGRLIEAAVLAGIVGQEGPSVAFRHRVIRDYFAASALSAGIPDGISVDAYIDPTAWWVETPWRAVLGFVPRFHGSLGPLVAWLGRAQPETAAMCIRENGDLPSESARQVIRGVVKQRLAESVVRPPAELAALGRALGMVGDDRPGVGVGHLTTAAVPAIEWVFIPEQRVPLSPSVSVTVPAFSISRYPLTNAQYEVFLRDGGYGKDRHWRRRGIAYRNRLGWCVPEQYGPPFDFPNHPVVGISSHEALAFCDWLGELRGERVALPTVAQWMAAARSGDGFEGYPWGNDFSPSRSNSRQAAIRTTTAVGVFASGVSHFGLFDCGGNVWELCAPDRETRRTGWFGGLRGRPAEDEYLPIKGGSFAHYWCSVKTRTNVTVREADREWDVGFRVMKRLH